MPTEKDTLPTALVILGGTGHLAQTKLFHALLNLHARGLLPENFHILGISRKDLSDTAYQTFVKEAIAQKDNPHEKSVVDSFCARIQYVQGSFNDAGLYTRVKENLNAFEKRTGSPANTLFYLAVPPVHYETIFKMLAHNDMMHPSGDTAPWSRILVEKPFGKDLETARALEQQLCELFVESQIYRIDHYLAKNAIENILALRFSNPLFAHSWTGEHIESISVRLFETEDVASRGSLYDDIGALRDVGQNHLLQILSLLTMNFADAHDAPAIRVARKAILDALVIDDMNTSVRGQYVGFTETLGVAPTSTTETYFKIGARIDTSEWRDVQISLESGKALSTTANEAVITFKPLGRCSCAAQSEVHEHRTVLHLTFSPVQNIRLTTWMKKPGFAFELYERTLTLEEQPAEIFRSPEAYECVLYDCIIGDQARFLSGDEVEAAWQFIMPVLEKFKTLPLYTYAIGSHGPEVVI